ncbi:MAG TPA: hypothetical protein DCE42_27860 [Myxococcales bacterium]|nr:hypothetical protein [Deltaproteobacteria bacterium]MBU49177.1 hypothetical protein [Deltaproteobacteria bacterium]HAA58610.1 hypothetical protein [Myxococcales bacterium]|tara:strand:+ start:3538 stop:4722 length:1185 start_codon:yes stop_codon:yes gene_type:complete
MSELEKIQSIRAEFPAVQSMSYLNTGTCGPLPVRTVEAMQQALQKELHGGRASIPGYISFFDRMEDFRAQLASWVGATPDEVLMTHHTTEGMNIVLWGLDWQQGDEIITTTHEHQGLLAPLAMLHQQFGVQVRYIEINGDVEHDTRALSAAINKRTRLIAMSHVDYMYGTIFPLEALAEVANQQDIPMLIDGAQSVGVFDVDVKALGVPFYAFPGQKWLCGPEGTGGLYVDADWISRVQPTFSGIFSIRDVAWFDQTSPYIVPAIGARRYQHGGYFRPIVEGFSTSLSYLDELGRSWIFSRIKTLAQRAYDAISNISHVRLHTEQDLFGSLLTFSIDGLDGKEISAMVEKHQVEIRYVPLPNGASYARASFGFYNDEGDVERLVKALEQCHPTT